MKFFSTLWGLVKMVWESQRPPNLIAAYNREVERIESAQQHVYKSYLLGRLSGLFDNLGLPPELRQSCLDSATILFDDKSNPISVKYKTTNGYCVLDVDERLNFVGSMNLVEADV